MKAVKFDDTGRTFTCEPGSSPATPGTLWWWITISGEAQRYAAFRVEPDEQPGSLKPRVLAFYAQLLADRERPLITRPSWAQRKTATAASNAGAGEKNGSEKAGPETTDK
jgi:hypothetical protein